MTQVNPPPRLRIPDVFLNDPKIRDFFEKQGTFNLQMYNRTGGSDDAVEDLQAAEVYEQSAQSLIEDEIIGDFETPSRNTEFRGVPVNTNTTANVFEFLVVTSAATIKLPLYPDGDDLVIVLNKNGRKIITDGNGKLINGESTTISFKKNTTITYHYFADLDEWFMR